MRRGHLRLSAISLIVAGVAAVAAAVAGAQPRAFTLRLALVSQWVIDQHRAAPGEGTRGPAFRSALEGGVVDRAVFWWQRGIIQRAALVPKPIRVLSGPEAETLGGRGGFTLAAVRPPAGPAAWTEVEVHPRSGGTDDVLVVEVGWEWNTVHQVLETLLVTAPDGTLRPLGLARPALVPGEGVPVVTAPFGRPVALPEVAARFRGRDGLEFLVARSPIEVIVDGDVTPRGRADRAASNVGDWREGDRVYVRVPLATLRSGPPDVVLAWKDRSQKEDPDGGEMRPVRLRIPR